MYAKLNNGQVEIYPYTIGQLRKDNSNVSFPKVLDDETLALFNVVKVSPTTHPGTDHTKNFSLTVEKVGGKWVEKWLASNASAEEVAERTRIYANNIRADRDKRLADTDWTQVADAPVDSAVWSVYRQSLRDIPSQEGFPWNVVWPTQPE